MDRDLFRKNFRYLIESNHVKILDLAKDLGLTNVTLSRYLSGERTPDLDTLLQICDIFDVSSDWLIGRKQKSSPVDIQDAYVKATLRERAIVNFVLGIENIKEEENDNIQ